MAAHSPGSESKPIRLKVVYKSATSLVTEYTTSVSKGGCRLATPRPLPVGTRFVFEMISELEPQPVEVQGRVIRCTPTADGRHDLDIAYEHSDARSAQLERIVEHAFHEQQYDKLRKHVRMPVNLVADDALDVAQRYLIRDLSIGGLGAKLPAGQRLTLDVAIGVATELTIVFDARVPLRVLGQVVWAVQARDSASQGGFGIEFRDVSVEAEIVLEAVCRLERPSRLILRFLPTVPR